MIVNIALLSLIEASVTLNREVIASHGFEIEFDEKSLERTTGQTTQDRKSVVQGKSVDLGGRRIIKKKKEKKQLTFFVFTQY